MDKLEPDQVINEIVPFATDLYLDYRGIKQSSDDKEDEKEDKKK
ncbi:hypothetical protein Q5M85_21310 [Paraclostridium bifermentans]|nr:hypothetical protein [Paraclostridium bifermentans]